MKIGVKIVLVVATAVIGLVVLAVVSINSLTSMNDMFYLLSHKFLKNQTYAIEMRAYINNMRNETAVMLLSNEKVQEGMERNTQYITAIQKLLDSLKSNAETPEMNKFADRFEDSFKKLQEVRNQFKDLMAAGKVDQARDLRSHVFEDAMEASVNITKELIDYTTKESLEYCDVTSNEEQDKTEVVIMTTIGIILAVMIVISLIIITGITKSLKQAVEAAGKIAQGNLDVNLVTNSKDETGILLHSLDNMKDAIEAVVKGVEVVATAAGDGDLSKRVDATKMKGAWQKMSVGMNDVVNQADNIINDAGKVLETMSTGDLTVRVTGEFRGKFKDMKDNINNLGDSLADLISQLAESIHTTAAASSEISATADTLAAATQEQSSQTEEVATAMEEMSRTVTENANGATQTAQVAKQSGVVATDGGKVVEQTIDKMKEIATVVKMSADNITKLGESSKKIGEIVNVIDDIADQTNLLSLNAAIEAARAGEMGRGFAVVADSVGKLAISTAAATKEIADMIRTIQTDTQQAVAAMEKGTQEVQSGIELADKAGSSIQTILQSINELLDRVTQIAAASEEQSATSEEISKNVSSISKVTAESARNVEGVASTATELAKMTETLTALVSQFKADSGGSSYGSAKKLGHGNDRRKNDKLLSEKKPPVNN